MEYLISNGANINAKDKYELSGLHHAAMRGNVNAIKKLLKVDGIEKEPRDVAASTPLHLAATYNHIEVAKVLLEEGANPRCQDNDQRTPLHEACLEGNLEIVVLLLKEGTKRFKEGYTRSVI